MTPRTGRFVPMAKAIPFALMSLVLIVGCDRGQPTTEPSKGTGPEALKSNRPALTKLETKDTVPGKGPAAAPGDLLFMTYKGYLGDDSVFDRNDEEGGKPFTLVLGSGQVIKGWDEGLVGMKVGGKRTLSIPWSKGYGDKGQPPKIPPKADLYFDVALLDMVKKGEEDIIDRTDVKVGTGPIAKKGSTVTVEYKGTLVGGKEFDSTAMRKKPATFKLGDGKIYEFFEYGVEGMKKGGVRKLRVPPAVGFGPGGNGAVGPNELLYYEITLKDVK